MYRVALNTALLSFRKKKLKYSDITSKELAIQDQSGEETELKTRIAELYKHLASFNNLDKAIVFLYIEKCPYQEISEITGISEKNVSVRLVRIKEKLRRMFNTEKH
jgi:RNA polymerase sigma-70 factor (ECF subfamily)